MAAAAAAAVVVAIVVVITVAIVGLLLVLLLLLRFSFGCWHIFHGYDLLVVQGCWLKHPTEAAAQLHGYSYSNNNSSRTSAQFVVAK